MFDEYHTQVIKVIDDQIKYIYTDPQVEEASVEADNIFADSVMNDTVDDTNMENEVQHRLYIYAGKMWHVPSNFSFPSNVKLLTGCQLWICGHAGYKIKRKVNVKKNK